MMTIREVIAMLTQIFQSLMEFLAPLFEKKEEGTEEETTEAVS